MVTARRPKAKPRRRATLAEKFERVSAEPIGTPLKLTKREARYFLRKLAGSDPHAPRGEEVIMSVRGDWGERLNLLGKR
jgi:hypothetical protein